MDTLRLITAALFSGSDSFSVLLFVVSALFLIVGVAIKTKDRVRLRYLEHVPLNHIEFTHPHLPSARVIAAILLCTLTLLLAGLQTVQGIFPFDDPYRGLNLISFFLIAGAVGILAELHWKGGKEYVSAALVGTALAFLLLIMHVSGMVKPFGEKLFLLVLLLPSMLLVGYIFSRQHRIGTVLTLLFSFLFWMTIALVARI